MCARVAVVYNEPGPSRYDFTGEQKAAFGVLEAVEAVHHALVELGYAVTRVALMPPIEHAREKLESLKADLVFNLFEGFCAQPETEALVPQILSEIELPYTGCPVAALKLALDKAKSKAILAAAGIDTPHFQLLNPRTLLMFQLAYPCIVKPGKEDASHGLTEESVVNDLAALERQVKVVSNHYGGEALVEEFINGREFNVTVLGDTEATVLPVSEIAFSLPLGMPKVLTFAAKWEPDSIYFRGTKAICPAKIEAEEQECIRETALASFRLFGCRGYARVDMRLDNEGRLNVLEVNPNPDISHGAGAVLQAEAAGMTYTQFIEKIVLLALEKK